MEVKVNRRSATRKPPKVAAAKPRPKVKWDAKAKARIIAHFKKDLNRSMGVKR